METIFEVLSKKQQSKARSVTAIKPQSDGESWSLTTTPALLQCSEDSTSFPLLIASVEIDLRFALLKVQYLYLMKTKVYISPTTLMMHSR